MESVENEIDPKLFMLCRLCLDEMGVFQIIPRIKEEIQYCFDIVIEPYDGYSQLICKTCKNLLNEYSAHKRKFIEKQSMLLKNYLKNKDNDSTPIKPALISNPSQDSDTESASSKNAPAQIKRRNRILSSSSDSSESSKATKKKRKRSHSTNSSNKLQKNWKQKYSQNFACRLCTKTYKNKYSLYRHCNIFHIGLRSRYKSIIENQCKVNLYKLDEKPNVTGLTNTVVLTKNKIVQDNGDQFYYNVYLTQDGDSNFDSDSSDNMTIGKMMKRNNRIDSKSSNETVLIGDNNSKSPNNDDESSSEKSVKTEKENIVSESKDAICIIDDSSDSEVDSSRPQRENVKTVADVKDDLKIINEIISACRFKYETRKKSRMFENEYKKHVESQLKHKVLSIGRKTINRRGPNNCVGLLRYLEHKNLNVLWIGKSQNEANSSKEASYVRISIVDTRTEPAIEESGWVDVEAGKRKLSFNSFNTIRIDSVTSLNPTDYMIQETGTVQKLQHVQVDQTLPQANAEQISHINQLTQAAQEEAIVQQENINIVQQPPTVQLSQTVPQDPGIEEPQSNDQAVLYANVVDDSNTKKLLNPTPVANPKQLPKKTFLNDSKPIMTNSKPIIDESKMMMPIITSTTSLAEPKKDDTNSKSEDAHVSNTDKPAPRIKVKPASELMKPSSILNTISNQSNSVWGQPHQNEVQVNTNAMNIYVPNNLVSQIQSQSMPPSNLSSIDEMPPEQNTSTSEYIVLDTIDLPNTKTDSPFKYFRNLLLLHNIILVDSNAPLSSDYICLLKFKVQFKQENKNLTLCLSLFCSNNKFCVNVRDSHSVNINIGKMAANWQWEIMKVFQGDVTNKIVHNAQKVGQNIYTQTKTFLYLLKSINQKQTD